MSFSGSASSLSSGSLPGRPSSGISFVGSLAIVSPFFPLFPSVPSFLLPFSVFYVDCFSLSLSSLMLLSFSSISPMLSLSSVLFLCLFLLLRLLLLFFILFILPLSCPPLLRPSRLVLVYHIGLLLVIIVSSLSASPSIDSHASSSFFHHVLSQVRYLSIYLRFSSFPNQIF